MIESLIGTPVAYLITAFLAFFAGFAVGRRQGKREGFGEGVRYAPLEMRRQAWEEGHCVICGSGAAEGNGRAKEAAEQESP